MVLTPMASARALEEKGTHSVPLFVLNLDGVHRPSLALACAPLFGRGRQQTQPVNRRNPRVSTRNPAPADSTWGLNAHSRKARLKTGEAYGDNYL